MVGPRGHRTVPPPPKYATVNLGFGLERNVLIEQCLRSGKRRVAKRNLRREVFV